MLSLIKRLNILAHRLALILIFCAYISEYVNVKHSYVRETIKFEM